MIYDVRSFCQHGGYAGGKSPDVPIRVNLWLPDQSRKFLKFVATPKSRLRTN